MHDICVLIRNNSYLSKNAFLSPEVNMFKIESVINIYCQNLENRTFTTWTIYLSNFY